MCARYKIVEDVPDDELMDLIGILQRKGFVMDRDVKLTGEIFPCDSVPVLAANRALNLSAFAMTWGYTLNDGKKVINSRSETASVSPMFREGMERHRCLIPASCYYEWQKIENGKVKFQLQPEKPGTFYLAGIYRMERNQPVFSVLTRTPGDGISFIHSRMPVIFPAEIKKDWLNPACKADELLAHSLTDLHYASV